jgi:hypothetical protein
LIFKVDSKLLEGNIKARGLQRSANIMEESKNIFPFQNESVFILEARVLEFINVAPPFVRNRFGR